MAPAMIKMTDGYEIPDPDVYPMKIIGFDYKKSKREDRDDYVQVNWEIVSGEFKGSRVFGFLPKNATLKNKMGKFMKTMAPALWEDQSEISFEALKDEVMGGRARVLIEHKKDSENNDRANITAILPLRGSDEEVEEEEAPKKAKKEKRKSLTDDDAPKKKKKEPEAEEESDDWDDDEKSAPDEESSSDAKGVFPPIKEIKNLKVGDLKNLAVELQLDPGELGCDDLKDIMVLIASVHDENKYDDHEKKIIQRTIKFLGMGKPKAKSSLEDVAKSIDKKVGEIITSLTRVVDDSNDDEGDDIDW